MEPGDYTDKANQDHDNTPPKPEGDPVPPLPATNPESNSDSSADVGYAEKFIDQYGARYIVSDGGVLRRYEDKRGFWIADVDGSLLKADVSRLWQWFANEALRLANDVERARAGGGGDVDRLNALVARRGKDSGKLLTGKTVSSVYTLVKARIIERFAGKHVVMNPDEHLLNVANGVINLKTRVLIKCNPEYHFSYCLKVNYNPALAWPDWAPVCELALSNDKATTLAFQVWMGYGLCGNTDEEKVAFLIGGGRNSKNTEVDPVLKLMEDDLATTLSSDDVEFNERATKPMERLYASLAGKRHGFVSETHEGAKLNESFIKGVTGNALAKSRLLFKEAVQIDIHAKLTVATNHALKVHGTDEAIWSRFIIFDFNESFGTEAEVAAGEKTQIAIPGLRRRFIEEPAKASQVLNWLVTGCALRYEHGLDYFITPRMRLALSKYRVEQDVLGIFLVDVCDYVPDVSVRAMKARIEATDQDKIGEIPLSARYMIRKASLFAIYVAWCKENNHFPCSSTEFSRRILKTRRHWTRDDGAELTMETLKPTRHYKLGHCYQMIQLNALGERLLTTGPTRLHVSGDDSASDM